MLRFRTESTYINKSSRIWVYFPISSQFPSFGQGVVLQRQKENCQNFTRVRENSEGGRNNKTSVRDQREEKLYFFTRKMRNCQVLKSRREIQSPVQRWEKTFCRFSYTFLAMQNFQCFRKQNNTKALHHNGNVKWKKMTYL